MIRHERPRLQCVKCPWRIGTDPHEIPNGYCATKHASLSGTIAEPGALSLNATTLRIFACHATPRGRELPCVGWLVHQLGPGNNLGLRLAAMTGLVDANVKAIGPQHERFEYTLPAKGPKGPKSCQKKKST